MRDPFKKIMNEYCGLRHNSGNSLREHIAPQYSINSKYYAEQSKGPFLMDIPIVGVVKQAPV